MAAHELACPFCATRMHVNASAVHAAITCPTPGCDGEALIPVAWLSEPWRLWAVVRAWRAIPKETRPHNCRTDGCDLGHDTPPLAGPQKPPRCRLDREYGG